MKEKNKIKIQYLDKADVLGLVAEALTAHVEAVLAHDTLAVAADTAVVGKGQ